MERTLYVIAYDVASDKRLAQVRQFLKGYSTGGQKSVYECFLSDGELNTVLAEMKELIAAENDRVHLFRMHGRSETHALGRANQPKDPEYFYIG